MTFDDHERGSGRGVFGLRRISCCFVQPRTHSSSSLGPRPAEWRRDGAPGAAGPLPPLPPASLVQASAPSAREARDVLHPLPSARRRTSAYARSNRSSLVGYERHSKLSFGADDERAASRRAAFPSRTLGSLTAWQMLAADVQQEMELAADGHRDSRTSGLLLLEGGGEPSGRGRSSLVEPGLVMSEDSEVPLHGGEGEPSDAFQPGSTGGSSDAGAAAGGTGRLQEEFEVLEELGRGAFGCALKARRRADGALVCLKVMDTRSMGATERRMTRDEVRVLSSLQHPNIVRYDDCFFEAGQQYIALELCEEGDLDQLIKGRAGALLSEEEVMLKFVQLCLALQHVHGKGILHRDIKSSNMFLSRHGILKLGDFGISKVMAPGKSYAKTMVGTPFYFSPEVVEDKPYNRKSDVWAAGCVLYELATLQRPFKGGSVSAIAVKILRGTYAPLPEQYSLELRQLVAALLRRKPDQRPSIDEVLGMPYVRQAMRTYRDYVQRTVENRKASYFQSLDSFDLDCGTAELAAAQLLRQRGIGGAGEPSQGSAAAACGGPCSACQQQQQQQQQLSGVCADTDATVVVRVVAAAEQAASADLASALAAVGTAPGSTALPAAPKPAGQPQAPRPKHSTFSAVALLARAAAAGTGQQAAALGEAGGQQAAYCTPQAQAQEQPMQQEQAGAAKQPPSAACPASPRSMLLPGFASPDTTGSGAAPRQDSAASLAAGSASAAGAAQQAADAPHSSPDHAASGAAVIGKAADSVGDLIRRVPALLDQVQQLLEQQEQPLPPASGTPGTSDGMLGSGGDAGAGDSEDEMQQQRRLSRRAAVQECLEELHTSFMLRLDQALPPPAFPN